MKQVISFSTDVVRLKSPARPPNVMLAKVGIPGLKWIPAFEVVEKKEKKKKMKKKRKRKKGHPKRKKGHP